MGAAFYLRGNSTVRIFLTGGIFAKMSACKQRGKLLNPKKTMKKLIVILAAALVSVSAFGQGTILFNNRVTGQVDAPVSRADGTGAGAGVNAQLFLVTGGSTFTALSPATTFRNSSAAAAFYVVQPSAPVTVPGVPAGQQATIVMRAWEGPVGSSYETTSVFLKGQSPPITISLGGVPTTGAPIPDAVLVGLQAFSFISPEPSTLTLGLLGAAVLLSRRRK